MSENCRRYTEEADAVRKSGRAWSDGEAEIIFYPSGTGRLGAGGRRMRGRELWPALRHLNMVFDAVRLVRLEDHGILDVDCDGRLSACAEEEAESGKSYGIDEDGFWAEGLPRVGKQTRLRAVQGELLNVVRVYLEADGVPCALEAISRIGEMAEGRGVREDAFRRSAKLYVDSATGVYNRKYFEDRLCGLNNLAAVTMLSIENFHEINAQYGFRIGNRVLCEVADVLLSCVRQSDAVVRYGEDEFMLVFHCIPRDALQARLAKIHESVEMIRLESCAEMRLRVSIGCKYGPEAAPQMVSEASRLLKAAKCAHCGVVMA